MIQRNFVLAESEVDSEAAMPNSDFRSAMAKLDASLDAMAWALGIGRRMVAHYRKDTPVPRSVAMATRHLVEMADRKWEPI